MSDNIISNISTAAIPLATFVYEILSCIFDAFVHYNISSKQQSKIYLYSTLGFLMAFLGALGLTIPISLIYLLEDSSPPVKVINVIAIIIQGGYTFVTSLQTLKKNYDKPYVENEALVKKLVAQNDWVNKIDEVVNKAEKGKKPKDDVESATTSASTLTTEEKTGTIWTLLCIKIYNIIKPIVEYIWCVVMYGNFKSEHKVTWKWLNG